MTKAELTAKILDAITDPWNDCDADIATCDYINLTEATSYLADIRRDEDSADLEPDERLPEEVTPSMLMEVFNCDIKRARHEMVVHYLADWLTREECVCLHDNYFQDYENNDPEVIPVDFIMNETRFPFSTCDTENPDHVDTLMIGLNSAKTFNPNHEYCWFDKEKNQLFSSDTPFADGIIDAEAMARYFIDDASDEDFGYLLGEMDDDDIRLVFGTTDEDELLKNRRGIWS